MLFFVTYLSTACSFMILSYIGFNSFYENPLEDLFVTSYTINFNCRFNCHFKSFFHIFLSEVCYTNINSSCFLVQSRFISTGLASGRLLAYMMMMMSFLHTFRYLLRNLSSLFLNLRSPNLLDLVTESSRLGLFLLFNNKKNVGK